MTLFDPTCPYEFQATIDMAKQQQQQQQQQFGAPSIEAVYLILEEQKRFLPRAIRSSVIPLPPGSRIPVLGELVEFDRHSSWKVAMVATRWKEHLRRQQLHLYIVHIDEGQDPRTGFGTLQ